MTLNFQPLQDAKFQSEAICDASMKTGESQSEICEGFVVFCRRRKAVHAISWTSRRAQRVARSSSTAELFAAADAVDNLTHFKFLMEEVSSKETEKFIVNSRPFIRLFSTT